MYCAFNKVGCPARFRSKTDAVHHEEECYYALAFKRFGFEDIQEAEAAGQISEMAKQMDPKHLIEYCDVLHRIALQSKGLSRRQLATFEDAAPRQITSSVVYEQPNNSLQNAFKQNNSLEIPQSSNVLQSISDQQLKQPRSSSTSTRITQQSPIKTQAPFSSQSSELERGPRPQTGDLEKKDYLEPGDLAVEPAISTDSRSFDGFSKYEEQDLARRIADGFKGLEGPKVPPQAQKAEYPVEEAAPIDSRRYNISQEQKQEIKPKEQLSTYNSREITVNPQKSAVQIFFEASGSSSQETYLGGPLQPESGALRSQIGQQAAEIMQLRERLEAYDAGENRLHELEYQVKQEESEIAGLNEKLSAERQKMLQNETTAESRLAENEQLKKMNEALNEQLSKAKAQLANAELERKNLGAEFNVEAMQKTINNQQTEICDLIEQNEELLLQQTKTDQQHETFNNYIAYLNKSVHEIIARDQGNEAIIASRIRYLQDFAQLAVGDFDETASMLEQIESQFQRFAYESGSFAASELKQMRYPEVRRESQMFKSNANPVSISIQAAAPLKPRHLPSKPANHEPRLASEQVRAAPSFPFEPYTAPESRAGNEDNPARAGPSHNLADYDHNVFSKYQNAEFDRSYTPLEERSKHSGYNASRMAPTVPSHYNERRPVESNYLEEQLEESKMKHISMEEEVSEMVRESAGYSGNRGSLSQRNQGEYDIWSQRPRAERGYE